MSVFSELIDELGSPLILEHCGESSVTYTVNGVSTALTALVGPVISVEQINEAGDRELLTTRDVSIARDADSVYGFIAEPAENATITIDGEIWAVREIGRRTPSMTLLHCQRKAGVEVGRENYRTRA